MKKLLTFALGALLAFGMTACGAKKTESSSAKESQKEYSKKVYDAEEDGFAFHYVGGYEGSWTGSSKNLMEAASLNDVSKISTDVADKLEAKSLKYLYMAKITIDADAGWPADAMKNGEKITVDGKFTVKSIRSVVDNTGEVPTYGSFQWIPNPGDGGAPAHTETLTPDVLFMRPWQKDADEHGFDWDGNPVILTGETGDYQLIVAQYTDEPTAEVCNFGMAVVKL